MLKAGKFLSNCCEAYLLANGMDLQDLQRIINFFVLVHLTPAAAPHKRKWT